MTKDFQESNLNDSLIHTDTHGILRNQNISMNFIIQIGQIIKRYKGLMTFLFVRTPWA
jgi:hypothetical protein